jgi:integrator complex subunit 2
MYSAYSASGVTASFGEMLLLMAIHFHSNQLSAICELVCSTLGMKVSIVYIHMFRFAIIFAGRSSVYLASCM